MHTRTTPLLESVFQITGGVVVPIIVREENALCSVERIGEELLVQAVLLGTAVAHEDAVLAHVVWGRCLVDLVPDDDDFVEGGDFVFGEVKKGFVELGGALVGLDGDAASRQSVHVLRRQSRGNLRELILNEITRLINDIIPDRHISSLIALSTNFLFRPSRKIANLCKLRRDDNLFLLQLIIVDTVDGSECHADDKADDGDDEHHVFLLETAGGVDR